MVGRRRLYDTQLWVHENAAGLSDHFSVND